MNQTPSLSFRFASLHRHARTLSAILSLCAATSLRAEHFYDSWIQEFKLDSLKGQRAADVTTDSRGNVIMCGDSMSDDGFHQYYIAKYDGLDGHLIWDSVFGVTQGHFPLGTPTGDAFARSVAVDSADNVIVTGGASFDNTAEDIVTIKLTPAGGLDWIKSYDYVNQHGADEGTKVVIDASDNVIVAGTSLGNGSAQDFVTIKYQGSDGATNFTGGFTGGTERRYARTVSGINCVDIVSDAAVDKNGNIWVTGSSALSGTPTFLTLSYSSTGTLKGALVPASPAIEGSAKGVALNSAGGAVVTGNRVDGSGNDSYFTIQYSSAGSELWRAYYSSGFDDHTGGAQSVGVDLNDDVFVTGAVTGPNPNNTPKIVTFKYDGQSVTTGSVLWMTEDTGFSPIGTAVPNKNLPIYATLAHKLVVDGAGQVVVTGETQVNEDDDTDLYFAKFDGTTGAKLYASGYDGLHHGPDLGVAVAVDTNGNIAVAGTQKRDVNTIGYDGIVTLKYQRILAELGDGLTPNPTTQKPRVISGLNAPAIANNGEVAVRITLTDNRVKLGAILTQGPAGGTQLPIIQNDKTPTVPGYGNATFKSFGEPSMNPKGEYVFTAKLGGGVPPSKSNSLWTNLGGTLHLALQQGTPLPGLTSATVSAIMSASIRNSQLVALVKIAGPASANLVLVSLDKNNNGQVLLRTGPDPQHMVTVNGAMSYLTTLTALSPTATSPGDGRAQGDAYMVARGVLKDGRSAVFRLDPSGNVVAPLFSGGAAPIGIMNAAWKSFGLPAVGATGFGYAVLGTAAPIKNSITTANDTAIVYSAAGSVGSFTTLVAHEGAATPDLQGISYSTLSDPAVNSFGRVAYLATLKATAGSPAVPAAKAHALYFGISTGPLAIARTGFPAPDTSGANSPSNFASFTDFALPAGKPGGPIFVAKLSGGGATAANNVAVFGRDTSGQLRRLLRTGDNLGGQIVSSITLLKATPQAFTAARSFNENGGVVMLLGFTDHSTGLIEIGVP